MYVKTTPLSLTISTNRPVDIQMVLEYYRRNLPLCNSTPILGSHWLLCHLLFGGHPIYLRYNFRIFHSPIDKPEIGY